MNVSARRIAVTVAGGVTIGVLSLGLLMPATQEVGAGSGRIAPEFSALTIDAPTETRTLSDYRGSVLLLNVWATWCPPCLKEMPTMERLHQAYRDRGLHVVAVSVDNGGAGDLIREFMTDQGLTFEILHDAESAIFDTYALIGIPTTFLIDREGLVRATKYAADWFTPENRAEVERLLDE